MKAMHMVKKEVLLDINGRNDHIAQHVKEHLEERHIFAVNIMGAPGAGKTTSLENLIRALPVKSYVIEGDIESDRYGTVKKTGDFCDTDQYLRRLPS